MHISGHKIMLYCGFIISIYSINLKIKPGELIAIVGQVGSGKSSLISAILGEMIRLKGSVTLKVSSVFQSRFSFELCMSKLNLDSNYNHILLHISTVV